MQTSLTPLPPIVRLWLRSAPWLVLVGGLLLFGCSGDKEVAAIEQPPPKRSPVEVVTARASAFVETYQASAPAQAVRVYHLTAEVAGTLAHLAVDVGDHVRKGQVLARLDLEPLELMRDTRQAEVARTETRITIAKRGLVRQQKLHRQGGVSAAVLDEAELTLALAEADLKLTQLALKTARRDLAHGVISAPVDGEVTGRFPEVGAVLSPGAPIFHVARTDQIRLVAGLAEREVVYLTPGARVKVSFDAFPGQPFSGTIQRIGSVDEPGRASFPVEVHLNNPGGNIRPGMVARMQLSGQRIEQAVRVPAVALRRDDGVEGVFIVTDGIAHQVPVHVAALQDDAVVIDRGLEDGAQVVVVGHSALREDTPVQVTVADGEAVGKGRAAPAVYGLP